MEHLHISLEKEGLNKVLDRYMREFKIVVPQGEWLKIGSLRVRLGESRAHLENGKIEVLDVPIGDNRGLLKELDVVWDKLDIHLGLDIPKVCVGGWCVLPTPVGCAVRLPSKCFFKSDPDLWGTLPLAGLRHEFSSAFSFPIRKSSKSWDVYPKPEMPLDIDFIDMADMVGEALDRLIDEFIVKLLSRLPDWARDLVLAILGDLSDLIRRILDLRDDVMEWLSEKIGVSLGFHNLLISILLDFFFKPEPIYELANPYVLMDQEEGPPTLPKVTAKVSKFEIKFNKQPDRIDAYLTLAK